jgi:hypothetical protein
MMIPNLGLIIFFRIPQGKDDVHSVDLILSMRGFVCGYYAEITIKMISEP